MIVSENLKKKYKEAVESADLDVYKDILDGAMADKKLVEKVREHAEKAAEKLAAVQKEEARRKAEKDGKVLCCPLCDSANVESMGNNEFLCQECRYTFALMAFDAEVLVENGDIPMNVAEHMRICVELNSLYERKNRDYGDSFHKTYLEEGMAMARIRLTDKLERFKKLTREGGQAVKDESVRDTLIDMANYCIMTAMEMDREAEENGCG